MKSKQQFVSFYNLKIACKVHLVLILKVKIYFFNYFSLSINLFVSIPAVYSLYNNLNTKINKYLYSKTTIRFFYKFNNLQSDSEKKL